MAAKYKVEISDSAKRMLEIHMRFLAQVSKDAAKKKKKEIMNALRTLEQEPKRFPFLDEDYIPPNKYRKMFIERWYLVLYQIREDKVYVDYILDCRKNIPSFNKAKILEKEEAGYDIIRMSCQGFFR